jgi:hypothetical protein
MLAIAGEKQRHIKIDVMAEFAKSTLSLTA